MSYNDRVTIIQHETEEGFLDEEVTKEVKKVVPCYRGRLTNNQQLGIFGSYNLSAFKLHIQGIHVGIERIEYKGIPRSIQGIVYHRNSTVVVVQ